MILAELHLSKDQKVTLFKALAKDEEVQSEVRVWFDEMLLTSELRPIQRIAITETVTGIEDFGDEEREANLPEKIEALKEELSHIEYNVPVMPAVEREPTTKTEHRASLLVSSLKASGKDYTTANEIIDFLKCKLPEYCKIDEKTKNIRKIKQDVLRTAKEMFPGIELNKKKTGHREVRLVIVT